MSSLVENGIWADIADVMKDQLLWSPHLLLAALVCGLNFSFLETITLKFLVILLPASLQPLQLGCWYSPWGKHPRKRRWYLKMLQVSWLQKCLLQKVLQVQPMKNDSKIEMWTKASCIKCSRKWQIPIFSSVGGFTVPHWTKEGSIVQNYRSVLLLVPENMLHNC